MTGCALAFSFAVLFSTVYAYNFTVYETNECQGKLQTLPNIDISSGCQKLVDGMPGFTIGWTDDSDNDQVVGLFGDENCCNALGSTVTGWSADCQPVPLQAVKSFRVMDVEDINNGKEGQNYDC